ncbi:MAG: SDR family oxidoreductase [Anderseniella sp.]
MSKGFALVTGAGSGIGRACAIALAADGWTVVLTGRRESALKDTISEAGEAGANMQAISCDVTDPASVEALYAGIEKAHGRIDVVFNNAGTNVPPLNLAELTYEQWRQVIGVNLDGAFLIAKGAFTMMRDQSPQGGRIINNGSISAHVPRPGSAPYTSSKHAITGLTRCISLDGRPFNIACSQIDIGNAASAMTDRMKKGVPQADGSMKPEPVMDVSHVASSVVYMAGLPPEANVQFMTVMATNMPFIGRG